MAMTAMLLSTSAIIVDSFGSKIISRKEIRVGEKILLSVPGIRCQGSVEPIRDHFIAKKGIQKVEGDSINKTNSVVYENQKINRGLKIKWGEKKFRHIGLAYTWNNSA